MIHGIDISHLNDPVNFGNFSPEIKFVFMKATQGAHFQDPKFQDYWKAVKAKGLLHGAYHFWDCQASAQEQADNFLSRGVNFSLPGVLPAMIDLENQATEELDKWVANNSKKCVQNITDLINIVTDNTGKPPIIYTYKNYLSEYLGGAIWPQCPLWLAAYQDNPPGVPKGWNDWTFWQNSEHGTLSLQPTGGEHDLDIFKGTIEQLNAMANIV